jgi:transcription elongation factor GreA
MQTPQRKSGKFTGLQADPHLTQAKYDELKNKLERLKKYSQPRAIEEVKRLAEMGDFSENAAYQIAKGRLRGINRGILEITDHLKRAIIIQPRKTETVQIGSTVTVLVNAKLKDYLILGSSETDPLKGIISHNSPLGSALLGCRVDEIVKIKLKDKIVEYRIVEIN